MPKVFIPPIINQKENLVAIDNFDLGMITDVNADRLPENGLTLAQNCSYNINQLFRRNGTVLYENSAPDSNKILNIFAIFTSVSGVAILRFTKDKIYKVTSTGWDEITPSGSANSGGDLDYFTLTLANDRVFFCQGIDNIREIDVGALTYDDLGDASSYKYVTNAFNRIIGAYLAGGSPVAYQIGWSGNLDFDEWDPTVNISAGFTPLVNSPSDVDDTITGVYNGGKFIIITRLRSIWVGLPTQAATQPFNFYAIIPTTGADTPRTIVLTSFGLIWYSYENSEVYLWDMNSTQPQAVSISENCSRAIKSDINDPAYVFGSYSRETKCYSLFIANTISSQVVCWEYSFLYKNWVRNTKLNVSTVADVDYPGSSLSFDDLVGTFDDLVGTLGSLGGIVAATTRFYGFSDGTISTSPFFSGLSQDISNIVLDDSGVSFDTDIRSKIFELPPDNTDANLFRINVTPYTVGTVALSYSKDDGLNWISLKSRTFISSELLQAQVIQLKRFRKIRRIQFKVITSDCMFSFTALYIKNTLGGVAK